MQKPSFGKKVLFYTVMTLLAALFLSPVVIVLYNSFKGRFFIADAPFAFPNANTFVGLENYKAGIAKTDFFSAFGWSLFITLFSVGAIVLFCSMCAYYITRVKNRFTRLVYYLFVFSMIVPFQMVMFTMSKTANSLHLDNPIGILLIYLGFGSGLSVFILSGFVKALPTDIEEAALIDGAGAVRMFFRIILPLLKPSLITVAILNTMWIWNDYLLPYLVIGSDYKTIPIAVQYLQGGYGSRDIGALMALLVLAIIPIVVFYFLAQKHIVKGVAAGAVKG
ncbi:MAG: carbohydrate ABC transporter permease [Ruminococcaceae bacterium]|nr:carbohydrate ABC transporter permease [Oscillospiraceae bacterium]